MAVSLIWGAEGGIGRALCARLTAEGWEVYGIARQRSGEAGDGPGSQRHIIAAADVTDPSAVRRALSVVGESTEDIDLWIYAVGDITSVKTSEMTHQDWERIVGSNLTGAFITTGLSLPLLKDDAHLIFLGAISERLQLPGLSAYAAAKSGLEAYAAALAKEERRRKITVVRPTAVATRLWDKVPFNLPRGALSPDEAAERILAAYRDESTGTVDI